MRIAITGSSGLLGTALRGRLTADGHEVVRIVRREAGASEVRWDPSAGSIDAAGLEGLDGVVNLAGAGIGDERWSDERKRVLVTSRTESTDLLARTLAACARPPKVLLSGSAIGFYGDRGDEELTEDSTPGDGFLSELCVAWEAATGPAEAAGIRTAHLRTGIVLSADGGALAKMLLPFKLGIGGRLGSGQQWMSWISIDDHVRAMTHLLTAEVHGPVDLTAPEPARNIEFTKALGRELGRPTILPIPRIGPRLLLGKELAQALLYESQRVKPSVLERSGFSFRHATIEDALAAVLGDEEIA
ncbi:TIGR01777 family oxidoreductase [Actinospongicola halichondriae]|uniref:TIGR01777 family oxidoreductase n=1 Tax=Actinospongicola halichondriae TaxID=3236844 RepID=UPI003D4A2375